MKLKNVNLTLLILGILIFSSFAFYVSAQEASTNTGNANADPASTSSSDNSATDSTAAASSFLDGTTDNGNLTQELADKINALSDNTDPNSQQVSLDQIQQMVDSLLNSQDQQVSLPQVDTSTIKIEKEDYSGYSKSTAEKKKKEDVANYLASVFYIFASNSPQPITSASDTATIISQITSQITAAMDSSDTSALDQLSESGGKILDQLKDVPVPADLVDIHVKAMQYALYAQDLEKNLKPNTDDPIGEMVNYYKVEALIESLVGFSSDVETTLSQYNLDYSDIQSKVKSYGLDLPNLDTSTTDTSTDSGS
ncbi:MAG: hypothetical protein P4L62_00340 [Candidatus Pacebacteria bacterium]|nr:hypothetical protein [Candidatus Paceibacterota bacterium]MDR3582798.1 hypothetical protein [Candidatus Paceibacterota bacterium]